MCHQSTSQVAIASQTCHVKLRLYAYRHASNVFNCFQLIEDDVSSCLKMSIVPFHDVLRYHYLRFLFLRYLTLTFRNTYDFRILLFLWHKVPNAVIASASLGWRASRLCFYKANTSYRCFYNWLIIEYQSNAVIETLAPFLSYTHKIYVKFML